MVRNCFTAFFLTPIQQQQRQQQQKQQKKNNRKSNVSKLAEEKDSDFNKRGISF